MAPSKIMFAVGLALVAAGNILTESSGEEAAGGVAIPPKDNEAPTPRPRGRPPGSTNKPPETLLSVPDEEARFQANRNLIRVLVEGGQGEDVKKVIAKYSKTGLKDVPAASQADFEKDIAALSY